MKENPKPIPAIEAEADEDHYVMVSYSERLRKRLEDRVANREFQEKYRCDIIYLY